MKKHYLTGLGLLLAMIPAAAQVRGASQPELLLSAPVGMMAPVWSPDGAMIATTSDNYAGIYVANADGTDLRIVTTAPGAGYKMAWSADGKSINARVNLTNSGAIERQMRRYDVATGQFEALGQRCRTAAQPGADAATGIFAKMISAPAEAAKSVKALAQFAGKTVINPALSPDGSKIAFQIPGKGMWLINADGTGLKSLGTGSHPAWLPDSRTIVYTIVEDNGSEFTASTMMSVDTATGATATVLAQSGMLPMTPAVSPDGKRVSFENAADASIYVMNLKK